MKVIQVHNYYQIAGGEDTVVAAEKALLEENGHQVLTYYKHNSEIENWSKLQKSKLIFDTSWSTKTYNEFYNRLVKEKPDVCHVHNFLPLISPSLYAACKAAGVPVVQTLHNYRLMCTSGLLLRNGKVCEACIGKSAYGSVLKKCYRNSMVQTYTVARMIESNKAKKTWSDLVDAYICLTDFAKQKFVQHGLPGNKLIVKPNFIAKQEVSVPENSEPYFIFVGRLTASKGVQLLKEVAPDISCKIKVVGEGELAASLKNVSNLEVLGRKNYKDTLALVSNAKGLILPSLWYEGMPMTILEAFSLKTLVITSNIGAMQSMIRHQENGLLFEPGSRADLKEKLTFTIENKEHAEKMEGQALQDYKSKYSPLSNYKQLIAIYQTVLDKDIK